MKFLFLLLFASSALAAPKPEIKVTLQEHRTWNFKTAGVRFNNQFPGARVNACTQTGERDFRIEIHAENAPINNSAWFAFQVVSREPQTITVRLAYTNGTHRYFPKTSADGRTWKTLENFSVDRARREAVLTLEVGPKVLWVAGQEMFLNADFKRWIAELDREDFIKKRTFGRSMDRQPMELFEISDHAPPRYVFIVSRQHPPEVTGTFGLIAFIESLCGDSELARAYRRNFRTVVVPLMNPDGVREGHWRHNFGGVDLNRDWRNFVQPETRAVRDEILRLTSQSGARPYLLLDFHSTGNDVFYTQPVNAEMFPKDFTEHWITAIKTRFPDYKLNRSPSHNHDQATSKTWAYEQFQIPAITYEFGDNTDRALIRKISGGAAEEMMRLLNAARE